MIEEWQYELKDGNEKTFEYVFSEYYTTLCSVAYQYVKDVQISESVAEDVLFYLWEKREEILPLDSFKSYILRMVRNRSIDYLRREHKTIDINLPSAHFFVSDNDIFESYVRTELELLIEEKLKGLSVQCQRVFQLSRFENKTYSEISIELGISENTVKYHIKAAIAHLRNELSPYLLSLIPIFS